MPQQGRTPPPEPVSIPLWSRDEAGGIVAKRSAQFWRSTGS